MKARTRTSVVGPSKIVWAMIIVFICLFVLSAGLSFINVGFWFVLLFELIPVAVVFISTGEDELSYSYDFWDFREDKYKKKIIEYEGKYYRAYNFWGIYLRDGTGYKSVQDLMDAFPGEKKADEDCNVIGDL